MWVRQSSSSEEPRDIVELTVARGCCCSAASIAVYEDARSVHAVRVTVDCHELAVHRRSAEIPSHPAWYERCQTVAETKRSGMPTKLCFTSPKLLSLAQDQKALNFLLAVPQKRQLFWAIEFIRTSFALALATIIYMGVSSPLLEINNGVLQGWPPRLIWMLNTTAVTVSCVLMSSSLQALCDFLSEACKNMDVPTLVLTVKNVLVRIFAIVKSAKERFTGQPCFFVSQGLWLAQVVPKWIFIQGKHGFLVAFMFSPISAPSSEDHTLAMTDNMVALLFSNAVLAIGLALRALATQSQSRPGRPPPPP